MANQWIRANLSAARWPMVTELAGRSVIITGADMTYDHSIVSTDDTRDRGLPQVIYMHNCMPTAGGIQSIGYDSTLNGLPGVTDFDAAFPIFTASLNRFLFVPAAGKNYIYDAVVGSWSSVSPLTPGTVAQNVLVTAAFLRNQTYLYYNGNGCYIYNDTTKLLVPTALTGLTLATTKGLCAANGYLIAWSDTNVAWSSLTTPTDFTPSLVTGAGGGTIQEAKGKVLFCLPINGGFLVYCEQNVVSAKYSGNIQFPFIFAEIPGSAGVTTPERVSWQANSTEHYAWTGSGLQKLDKNSSTQVFPEISDFLSGLIFEDFDESALAFTTTYLNTPFRVKLTVIGTRFLVISYGVSSALYTHALCYDITLQRWGKFKIDHVDCFQWNFPNIYGALTYGQLTMTIGSLGDQTTYGDFLTALSNPVIARKMIAFLQIDGTVKIINFDFAETIANGVCVLGKFQLNRNRLVTHQESHIETARTATNPFSFYLLPSLLGKDFGPPITPMRTFTSEKLAIYGRRTTATNFCSLIMGGFDLTTYIMNINLAGQE